MAEQPQRVRQEHVVPPADRMRQILSRRVDDGKFRHHELLRLFQDLEETRQGEGRLLRLVFTAQSMSHFPAHMSTLVQATGLTTRDAFMRNVMSTQNFTHYPYIIELLHESEKLFEEIQQVCRTCRWRPS